MNMYSALIVLLMSYRVFGQQGFVGATDHDVCSLTIKVVSRSGEERPYSVASILSSKGADQVKRFIGTKIKDIPCGEYEFELKPMDPSRRITGNDVCKDSYLYPKVKLWRKGDWLSVITVMQSCNGDPDGYVPATWKMKLQNLPTGDSSSVYASLHRTNSNRDYSSFSFVDQSGIVEFNYAEEGKYILAVHHSNRLVALIPLVIPDTLLRSARQPYMIDVKPYMIQKELMIGIK